VALNPRILSSQMLSSAVFRGLQTRTLKTVRTDGRHRSTGHHGRVARAGRARAGKRAGFKIATSTHGVVRGGLLQGQVYAKTKTKTCLM
jgi:hypothetical protein